MIYTEIYVPPTAPAHYLITGLTRCSRYCTPTPPHGNSRSCTSECMGGALIRGRLVYVWEVQLSSPPLLQVWAPTRPHCPPLFHPPLLSYCAGGPTRPHLRRSRRTLPSTPVQSRSVRGVRGERGGSRRQGQAGRGGRPNRNAEQVSQGCGGGGEGKAARQPHRRAGQSAGR